MERYMYKEDSFERSLKQKVDEYRMYPSNQSWSNIQNELRKSNRSFNYKAIGLTIILLTGFSIYLSNHQQTNQKSSVAALIQSDKAITSAFEQTKNSTIKPVQKAEKRRVKIIRNTNNPEFSSEIIQNHVEKSVTNTEVPELINQNQNSTVQTNNSDDVNDLVKLEMVANNYEPSSITQLPVLKDGPEQKSSQITAPNVVTETTFADETSGAKTDAELNYEVNIPVVIKKKEVKKLEMYVTPSSSYRVLYADNKFTFRNFPQLDPENAVTHTPSLGFEAGASMLFPITKRIKFRTGAQFNYTSYNVNAFSAAPQVTTITLNYSTSQRITVLGNFNGYVTRKVQNETYQLSIPLGFEVNLAGSKKVTWEMGINLQPTYLLKASGYMLTNDYKNYIKAPDLMSRLNLNTGLESFIRWKAGKFQLQAGPQLRYQLFSNARNIFPVKEHLVDYGFRFGIIKPLR
jgi:hypothetical protein